MILEGEICAYSGSESNSIMFGTELGGAPPTPRLNEQIIMVSRKNNSELNPTFRQRSTIPRSFKCSPICTAIFSALVGKIFFWFLVVETLFSEFRLVEMVLMKTSK